MAYEVWIDDNDLEIIKHLISSLKKRESVRTWTLAKMVYPEKENVYILRDKEPYVRSRLKKLAKYGLIETKKDKDGTDIFDIKMAKFKLNSMPRLKKCISLKINNKWVVFEL